MITLRLSLIMIVILVNVFLKFNSCDRWPLHSECSFQVSGAEVRMLFNAGSGEMIKASLMMHIYVVAICRNKRPQEDGLGEPDGLREIERDRQPGHGRAHAAR